MHIPGQYKEGFESLTYIIKSDMPIPFSRRDQRQHPYPAQTSEINYPVHRSGTRTYNLFSILDKMQIKDYIEIPSFDHYTYAMVMGQAYAAKLRNLRKDPVQMYLRAEWHKQQQIGRLWRIG